MEILHMTTGFGDLYNTTPHPGRFDEMACACGTHPSTYTKIRLGWIDPSEIPSLLPGAGDHTLHAVALLHPAPPARVAGVRISSNMWAGRYFLARVSRSHVERRGVSSRRRGAASMTPAEYQHPLRG